MITFKQRKMEEENSILTTTFCECGNYANNTPHVCLQDDT